MKKYLIILLISSFILILMFINFQSVLINTKESINMLINSFIPSLLPYMIMISLVNELGGLEILGYFLQFIFKPFFNVNARESSLIVAGLVSGYPLPSLLLSKQEKITKKEQKIISIFVFPSLAFLLNQIVPKLCVSGFRLILTFVIGAIFLFFLTSFMEKEKVEYVSFSTLKKNLTEKYKKIKIAKLLRNVSVSSVTSLVIIGTNVVVFSLISVFMPQNSFFGTLLQGILEFSRASINLASQPSYLSYLSLIFVLLFGGLSVFMQNSALLSHTNFSLKKYIIYRLELIVIVIILDFLIFF